MTAITNTDEDIRACFPVMRELRPYLTEQEFLARVRRQQSTGYQLAFLRAETGVVAVAGFRINESLSWGRYLYVDDLVTLAEQRSQGHGAALLRWLRDRAVSEGCHQFHLDSGVQRVDAHRFYEREGLVRSCYHFSEILGKQP